jgi:hypothetical protein
MNTSTTRAAFILWDVSNRKNWEIAAKGTYEDAKKAATEVWENPEMVGMEIHSNKIKDSWNNQVEKTHFDLYMDHTLESRPMTPEEIEEEK